MLLLLIILAPWPFGSVHLRATQALAAVCLLTALAAVLKDGWDGDLIVPDRAVVGLVAGVACLGIFQLVPLPRVLHEGLAPASAFIWHPFESAAAMTLGPGPHSVSVAPDATRRWLAVFCGFSALVLAALPALRDRNTLFRSCVVVVTGGFAVALFGLVSRVLFGPKLYGVFEVPTVSPFGPFVSKNHFAGYVELCALLALGLALGLTDEAQRRRGRLGWVEGPEAGRVAVAWGVTATLFVAIPAALSRGGVVSLVVGTGIFVVLRLLGSKSGVSRRSRLLAAAGGVVLASLVLVAILPDSARETMAGLGRAGDEASGSYRLDVWRDSMRLIRASPGMGVGFGGFEDAFPRFKTAHGHLRVEHAENDYLELLAEGGAAAGLLFALLLARVVRSGWQGLAMERSSLPRALRVAVLSALATLLVHAVFDFNLRIPSNLLLFVALGGFALAPLSSAPRRPGVGLRAWPARALVVVLAGAVLLTVTTRWSGEAPRRIGSAADPEVELRRAALTQAIIKDLSRRPAEAGAWVLLAWLQLDESPEDALSLSRWGELLDPQHEELRAAARRVSNSTDH